MLWQTGLKGRRQVSARTPSAPVQAGRVRERAALRGSAADTWSGRCAGTDPGKALRPGTPTCEGSRIFSYINDL